MTFHPTSCGFLLSILPICQGDNHVPSKAMEDPFYVLIFFFFFLLITLKGKKKIKIQRHCIELFVLSVQS